MRDLAAAGDGAWLLASCDLGTGCCETWSTGASRLDASGEPQEGILQLTDPRGSELHPNELPYDSSPLAVDDVLGRRAALVWHDGAAGPEPSFVAFDREAQPAVPVTSARGVPLTRHRHLRASRSGYSCVAEHASGSWGVSLLQLDAAGTPVAARDLGLPTRPIPFQRVALPDRSFVLAWTEAGALHVRRYDEDGAPRTRAASVIDEHAVGAPRVGLALAGDGLLVVWEAVDLSAGRPSLRARRLDADGAPVAAARVLAGSEGYAGGLHTAAARGDVLVSAMLGEAQHLVVLALDTWGGARGEPIVIEAEQPAMRWPQVLATRVVATPAGALAAFEDQFGVVAVPLACTPDGANR